MAKLDIVRVPYKGAGPAMLSIITGESQVSFPNTGAAMQHVASGKVRALAGLWDIEVGIEVSFSR
jgi:tripartite-type tricarboxylate transporter receptor subunit TctC